MPWKVSKSDRCPASRPWAVINQNSGAVEGCHTSKAKGLKQAAALYANEGATMSNDDREVRTFPFEIEEVRAAENGRSKDFTIRGHAAVFNTWTDLGIFRERIAKGAFDEVLSKNPHVLHLIDHDTKYVLSSTDNKTLELRADPRGLHMWSKVAPTSYAADLRVLMERGDVKQSSFAFTVPEDGQKWNDKTEDGVPERTITRVGQLFDVTTTAMGAYATTDSQVAMRTLQFVRSLAEAPEPPPEEEEDAAPEEEEAVETEAPLEEEAADEEVVAAQDNPAARARSELILLKEAAKQRSEALREEQWRILKEM